MFSEKNTLLKLVVILAAMGSLVACGGADTNLKKQPKVFKRSSDPTSSSSEKDQQYTIDVTGARFTSAPQGVPQTLRASNALSKSIRGLKITVNLDKPNEFLVTLKQDTAAGVRVSEFIFENDNGQLQEIFDKKNLFKLAMTCELALCERASIGLTERATGLFVHIQYARSYEYLKQNDEKKHDVSAIDEALIRDAIKFRFPVERHSIRINGSEDADILIIQPPAVDGDDDDSSENNLVEPRTLELETRSVIYVPVPSGTGTPDVSVTADSPPAKSPELPPTPQVRTPPAPDVEPTVPNIEPAPVPTPPKMQLPATPSVPTPVIRNDNLADFQLTPNPFDVYDVKIPETLVPGGNIGDPLALESNFKIKPIKLQKAFEPAYRIAVIAQAFVDQNINVYLNACNIFVRAVMTLAGYTEGGHYTANYFGVLFGSQSQGLNLWENRFFRHQANSSTQTTAMDQLFAEIPENYATVVQIDRRAQGKNGHVGILTRLNGRTVFYDSSLRTSRSAGYPPQRSFVEATDLLKTSRPLTHIYSMPNMFGKN